MELVVLDNRNRGCTSCILHKAVTNVCIPMRLAHSSPSPKRVLVCVGEKPGVDENKKDMHLTGAAGMFFNGYVKYITQCAKEPVDIWVVNAVRCMPAVGAKVNAGQIKACSQYLKKDLELLRARYPTDVEIVLLGMGAPAAQALGYDNLGNAMKSQGKQCALGYTAFSTFNPAILMPKKNPAYGCAVEDHLVMLGEYLRTGKLVRSLAYELPKRGMTHAPSVDVLSIDIESYGSVDDQPQQNTFHPVRAVKVDGCSTKHLLQSAAVAWYEDGIMKTACWMLPKEWVAFNKFMLSINPRKTAILGMNLPFDISFMRAWSPLLKQRLTRSNRFRLYDLAVANFQYSDVRPERSLKEIAPMLRITDYDEDLSLKKGQRYYRGDPRLLSYNIKDAAATLAAWRVLKRGCDIRYKGSEKLSPRALKWFSDSLWTAISMSEAGVTFTPMTLVGIEMEHEARIMGCRPVLDKLLDGPVKGTGSKAVIQNFMDRLALASGAMKDKRLIYTPTTREISSKKDNLELFLGLLPVHHELRKPLTMFMALKKDSKVVEGYTNPLLTNKLKGLVDSVAWPTWFIVPSKEKDGRGDDGGTQQGRATCKHPALQTLPRLIKTALGTRFPGGSLLMADESQLELRVAALLSNDPLMSEDYRQGRDRHLSTARLIFDSMGDPKSDEFEIKRKVGKTLNFLVLYKGGATKFQETLRRMMGVEWEVDSCKQMIVRFDSAHTVFRAWQDQLIAEAVKLGYSVLPITGESRLYAGGKTVILNTYTPTICNFPVQAIAANIVKSAQTMIEGEFRRRNMRSLMGLNVYDAVVVESPREEVAEARQIIVESMTCPPYYKELQYRLGRTLPLVCDMKVKRC